MTNRAYENAQNDNRLHGAEYRKARQASRLAESDPVWGFVERKEILCCCLEIAGDDLDCLVHYPEGSDNTLVGQLSEAGFGSGGPQ
jgi:hypothetical protein